MADSARNFRDSSPLRWAVVGGGMLGLAAARKLLNAGHQVTLFEAAPDLGGLASSWKLGNVTWDKFYHVTLLSDSRLRNILAEVGLDSEIQWVQTKTGFYSGGKLYSLSSSVDFLRFPPLSLIEKFRLGSTIFYASKLKDWKRLESIPVADWLSKLSGRSTFQKIWQPLLRAKLGEAYERTSAAFIWAYIDRMYKARRSGMKREMFGFVPGGYRRVLEAISQSLRDRGLNIQCGSRVKSITQVQAAETPLQSSTVRWSDQQNREQEQAFDRVLVTVPTPITCDILPQLNADERQRLLDIEYLGVVCTSVLLDRPLGGYYVTNITDSWVPFTGIIEMGSLVSPEHLDGNYLVYLPRYLLANDQALGEEDSSIHERCLTTLEKMYPNFERSQVAGIQTARAKYVMAIPTLRFSTKLPSVVTSLPGIYTVTSAQIVKGTLNVNESIEHVETQLDEIVLPDSLTLAMNRS